MRAATDGAIRIRRIPCGKPPHLWTSLDRRSTLEVVSSCFAFVDQDMLECGEGSIRSPFFLCRRQVACATLEWLLLLGVVAGGPDARLCSEQISPSRWCRPSEVSWCELQQERQYVHWGWAVVNGYMFSVLVRSPFQTIQEARSVLGRFGCEVQISPEARLNRPFLPVCPNIATFSPCIRAATVQGLKRWCDKTFADLPRIVAVVAVKLLGTGLPLLRQVPLIWSSVVSSSFACLVVWGDKQRLLLLLLVCGAG